MRQYSLRSAICSLQAATVIAAAAVISGCHTDMWRQPKIAPMDAADSKLFVDGATARPLIPGTIPKGHLRNDQPFFTGIENGRYMDRLPMPVTRELLERGQERFDVFCSPCHSRVGDGKGMIARRGLNLRRPVGNYHTDRLRRMPVGYFYDVMTNGYGAMYSYASRVEPHDRWAIAAYIRALQLSQNAPAALADPTALREGEALAGGHVAGEDETHEVTGTAPRAGEISETDSVSNGLSIGTSEAPTQP